MWILLSIACSTPTPETVTEVEKAGPAKAAPSNKGPCTLLEPATISNLLGPSSNDIRPQAEEKVSRNRSCSWIWEGGRVDVQVSPAPPKHVDGWAPRMVTAKLQQNGVAEPGLGRSAAYREKDNQIFWERADGLLFSVSIGGDRPNFRVPHDKLRSVADHVDRTYHTP